MAQATDIVLGGVGYMLVPGKYARTAEAIAGSDKTGRQSVDAFGKGLRQGIEDPSRTGSGSGWDGLKVTSVGGGQGIEPWPADAVSADSIQAATLAAPPASAIQAGYAFVGIGRFLYRSAGLSATSWSALTQVYDAGAGKTITDLVQWSDDLLVLLGPSDDIIKFNTQTNTAAVWRTGEKGVKGIAFKGQALYTNGVTGTKELMRCSLIKYNGNAVTDERWLDSPIVAFGMWGARAAIATKRSLWLFDGRPDPGADVTPGPARVCQWIGEPEPLFTHGTWVQEDDFPFLLAFAGRLWTWVGNRIVSWDGTANGRWMWERLEGQTCLGATVAGGFLVLTLIARNGNREVWATDGAGWWLIDSQSPAGAERMRPANLAGCGGWDVAVFRNGASGYDRYRLEYRSSSAHAYPSSGSANWVSSLLDAGQPAAIKTWRRVGARFAWPEARGNAASTDGVQVFLDYSVDLGATWTQLATATASSGATRQIDLEGALPNGTRSRWLQVRVRWASVLDWAPVLSGVWADWALSTIASTRRRWDLTIRCGDRLIRRDGAVESRSGRSLAADLWAAWDSGGQLALRDIDADATDATYAARIVAIRETAARPADAGRWGETELALTLVEG